MWDKQFNQFDQVMKPDRIARKITKPDDQKELGENEWNQLEKQYEEGKKIEEMRTLARDRREWEKWMQDSNPFTHERQM